MTDALQPPEQYAHLPFHWIIWQPNQTPVLEVMEYASANGGSWSRCGLDFVYGMEEARENGWRYHGPCDSAASAPDPENTEMAKTVATIIDPRAWEVENDPTVDCNLYQNARAVSLHKARAALTALRDSLTVKLGW